MADLEDENFDLEQLGLPGEGLAGTEPLPESAASDDQEAAPAVDQDLAAESSGDEDQKAESGEDETEEEKKGGLLETLGKANPYTVMLGLALAFILTSLTCLFLEWNSYERDISASDYTQRAK